MDFLDTRQLRRESLEIQTTFVEIELDLAETFCRVAITADQSKAERNVQHARRALSMASKFAERIERNGRVLPKHLEDRFRDVRILVGNFGDGQADLV